MLAKISLVVIVALMLVPAADAGNTPGILVQAPLVGSSGNTATLTVLLTTRSAGTAPGGQVAFSNCKFGNQRPLVLANRTRHMDGEKEHLMVDKIGELVWETVKTIPPKGSRHPQMLTLNFLVPQGYGSRDNSFCVHVSALAFATGDRYQTDIRIPLG